MFRDVSPTTCGPVRVVWRPYRHGTPAEAEARPWLAEQLQVALPALRLHRDARGRPRLDVAHGDRDVSWSHSGDGLLVALGDGVELGVDLEFLRPRPRAMALAQRFFAADEAVLLATMPAAMRDAAFVRLWCAKEAVLKAHGHGLSFGLHRLSFVPESDGADHGWRMVDCDPALGQPRDWTLHAFTPMPGYAATLAWRAR